MIIKAAVRHADGKKNLYEIAEVESREDAVIFLKKELGAKTTILTLVDTPKHPVIEKVLA